MFSELKIIGDVLVSIQGLQLSEKSLTEKINIIKNALQSISSVTTDDIVNNLTGLSSALDEVIDKLIQQFPPEFNKLGQVFADNVNKGFKKKLDLKTILKSELAGLSTEGASTAGTKIAEAINSSLKNNLNIGDTIRDAINLALQEKYSTKIDVELNTKETKTTTTKKKSSNSSTTKASGGLVAVKTP